MAQSYPAQKLMTTDSYFIIPVDTKCVMQNSSLQLDVINASGALQYKVEYTLWPVQKCVYPTYNTPEDILNSQATWVTWINPTANPQLVNIQIVIKGIKVTLISAGTGDSLTVTFVQQGVL